MDFAKTMDGWDPGNLLSSSVCPESSSLFALSSQFLLLFLFFFFYLKKQIKRELDVRDIFATETSLCLLGMGLNDSFSAMKLNSEQKYLSSACISIFCFCFTSFVLFFLCLKLGTTLFLSFGSFFF